MSDKIDLLKEYNSGNNTENLDSKKSSDFAEDSNGK